MKEESIRNYYTTKMIFDRENTAYCLDSLKKIQDYEIKRILIERIKC